jgi:hypothetical protein
MTEIQEFAKARGINMLFHFTRLDNLDSILNHGLLPRDQCHDRGIAFLASDQQRLDGTGAVCLSIGFPNYKMFYSYRKQHQAAEWAVLLIKPEVLWTKICVFCRENAAKNAVTCIPFEQRMGVAAIASMYEPFGERTREELGISDVAPTNPQAELLCFEPIELELIFGAAFQVRGHAEAYKISHPQFQFFFQPLLFKPRKDFAHWRKIDG